MLQYALHSDPSQQSAVAYCQTLEDVDVVDTTLDPVVDMDTTMVAANATVNLTVLPSLAMSLLDPMRPSVSHPLFPDLVSNFPVSSNLHDAYSWHWYMATSLVAEFCRFAHSLVRVVAGNVVGSSRIQLHTFRLTLFFLSSSSGGRFVA